MIFDDYEIKKLQGGLGYIDLKTHVVLSSLDKCFTKVEQRIPEEITVANTDGLLKPGMMVVVGIVKD